MEKLQNKMNAERIAQTWLDDCCRTIERYDHPAHMNLISEDIQVLGVPGFDVIGYADWYAQCEYEFNEKLIAEARYAGLKLLQSSDSRIMFLTNETIRATDGTEDNHPLEVVLAREADGRWRVIQERLLSRDEASQCGLTAESAA